MKNTNISFDTYWNSGTGKELQEWTGAKLNLQQFEKKRALYFKKDEIATAVVKEFYAQTPISIAQRKINQWLRGETKDKNIPDSVSRLLEEVKTIPPWVDQNLLQRGAELCVRTERSALIVLRDYTLMGGYDFSYLVKPLIYTGVLHNGVFKRLSATLDFWVAVTRPDGLLCYNRGFQATVQTRIIHALARNAIYKKFKNWDTEKWGVPINTWDMVATSIGFSLIFLHGLKKLGYTPSHQEEKGLFHLWKYIGFLLGIPVEELPENKKEATEYFYLWTYNQSFSDKDSIFLANALLQEAKENDIFPYAYQRKMLYRAHISCSRFFLDQETVHRLQIPQLTFPSAFPHLLRQKNKLSGIFYSRKTALKKGNLLQEKIVEQYNKGSTNIT